MGWEQLQPTLNYANHIQILPSQTFGPRINPDYQIICVHCGKGKIVIDGREYKAKKGDFFSYGPDIVHKIEGDANDPFFLSGAVFDLDRTALEPLGTRDIPVNGIAETEDLHPPYPVHGIHVHTYSIAEHIHLPLDHRSFELFEQLVQEYEHDLDGREWICRGILIQLLGSIFRSHPLSSKMLTYPDYYHVLVKRLADLEKKNELQHHTVQTLASEFGFSPSYFYTIFRNCFDISPQDFLIQARIRLAKRLLRHSQQQITEIAQLAGFTNVHYFSRMFRKKEGTSPSVYRKQSQRI